MESYARTDYSDSHLLHSATTHAGHRRAASADLLADIAEIDARKLYLPAAYPSMAAYCVGDLKLSEQSALKAIRVARLARRFPAIFGLVAEGRLHLTDVVLLAPHLTEHTAADLLAAAADKTRVEIERLLAERFPQTDVLSWVTPSPSSPEPPEQAPALGPAEVSPGTVHTASEVARAKPLSAHSFDVQLTMSRKAHDHLCYARSLLGHQVPSGDIAQVIERALAVYVEYLEKKKLGAGKPPRPGRPRRVGHSRYIPLHVRRAVWERDSGQCTYVSENGHRCPATHSLEFDHVVEFARGGEATVEGIRLLCRAHNQHQAERTFGSEFMRHKRIAASEFRAAARARAEKKAHARAAAKARQQDPAHVQEVIPCLRSLGYRAGDARDAARRCMDMPDASLEQRVRVALSHFRLRGTKVGPWTPTSPPGS